MVKRRDRLEKGIESIKKEIENHFEKLDNEIKNENDITARYHIKEIDKSLIDALEYKIGLLGINKENRELVNDYRKRIEEYKDKLGIKG